MSVHNRAVDPRPNDAEPTHTDAFEHSDKTINFFFLKDLGSLIKRGALSPKLPPKSSRVNELLFARFVAGRSFRSQANISRAASTWHSAGNPQALHTQCWAHSLNTEKAA